MAKWRREFAELFPDVGERLSGDYKSIHAAFIELRDELPARLAMGDTEFLRRMFAFAESCLESENDTFINAVYTCLLEHVFQDVLESQYLAIRPYLTPRMLNAIETWGFSAIPDAFKKIMHHSIRTIRTIED
jgi:hypothetical protein